ncbi:hypothetical protein CBP12_10500 [Oceanisphaera avium]|uniref:Uncharacterized protein n=1 Tax=Oceanisphaera avium TaxID=1903694 RepID=A0A1Y0CZ27_9GAMM|nr:hypothetical protein CBP12_10500 [Oceanisphaera avium]
MKRAPQREVKVLALHAMFAIVANISSHRSKTDSQVILKSMTVLNKKDPAGSFFIKNLSFCLKTKLADLI